MGKSKRVMKDLRSYNKANPLVFTNTSCAFGSYSCAFYVLLKMVSRLCVQVDLSVL